MTTPTDEQTAAADAFRAGDHLVLQAGAGTGKTTTLALLAHATPRHGRYLAYNRAIATDATTRFPATVTCTTAHSLAYARPRPPLPAPPQRPPPARPGKAARTSASPGPSGSAPTTSPPARCPTPHCAR